jgi:hypothetical protein
MVAVFATYSGQTLNCEHDRERAGNNDTGKRSSEVENASDLTLEKLLYQKLEKDKYIRHPKFPYVFSVEGVQGRKLR